MFFCAITVGGEIYGERGSSLYLMTGTRDVTMCTDIVYGELTFRLASFLVSRVPICGRALLENAISYHNSDFTVAWSE